MSSFMDSSGHLGFDDDDHSPPLISLTPSRIGDSLGATTQKSRSRAGTLPSSFLLNPTSGSSNASSSPLLIPNSDSLLSHHSGNSFPGHNSLLLNPHDNNNNNNNNNSNNNNNNASSGSFLDIGPTSRRMRSGSLFSTNSIWNDEALAHSPSQSHTGLNFDNISLHSFDTINSNNNAPNTWSSNGGPTTSSNTTVSSSNNNNNNNSNSNNSSGCVFSPLMSSQGGSSSAANPSSTQASTNFKYQQSRNRAYTTAGPGPTNASLGMNFFPLMSQHMLNTNQVHPDQNRQQQQQQQWSMNGSIPSMALLTSPQVNPSDASHNLTLGINNNNNSNINNIGNGSDINMLLDGLLNENDYKAIQRHRAQTYSGSTTMVLEHSIQAMNQHYQQMQQQQQQSMMFNNTGAPNLQDEFDFNQLIITTTFENTQLGPTQYLLFDNLPQYLDADSLLSILNSASSSTQKVSGFLQKEMAVRSIRMATVSPPPPPGKNQNQNSTNSNPKIALVECANVDIAMALKARFNHLEGAPGKMIFVAFAQIIEDKSFVPIHKQQQPMNDLQTNNITSNSSTIHKQNANSNLNSFVEPKLEDGKSIQHTDIGAIKDRLMHYIRLLNDSSNDIDMNKVESFMNHCVAYPKDSYQNNFGPLPEPIALRQFDSPKLRELRKILENNENALLEGGGDNCGNKFNSKDHQFLKEHENEEDEHNTERIMTTIELEELALAMLDELPELCYDYLGNTIIQKLFIVIESPVIKLLMVKEIVPYLTQLSIHKNGTWAIQKIIHIASLSSEDVQQKQLIGNSLKPYAVKLFNDQFGNYVLQGCIKFGPPFNDFIFETVLDNFLEISFGRFGARCIRTILETADGKTITKEQVSLVAALIVEYANDLVVNNNGSLLITWFLDTYHGCSTDDKLLLLTEKFLPHLDMLCSHRLANLTILKILNNRAELKSKLLIMEAIFGQFHESEVDNAKPPSKLLELLLKENINIKENNTANNSNDTNNSGPLFIYKILSTALSLTYDTDSVKSLKYQQYITQQIRRILLEVNVINYQPYKKLMDEVGLASTRLNRSSSITRRNKRNNRSTGGAGGGGGGGGNNGSHKNGHKNNINNINNGYGGGHNPTNGNQQSGYNNIYNTMGIMGMGNNNNNTNNMMGPVQYGSMQQHQYPPQGMYPTGGNYYGMGPPPTGEPPQGPYTAGDYQVMQQLEQLSLSSAALGYVSNPGTPSVASNQRNYF
ncbi:uncharacterized protein KQ657_003160 [Scheffersomyces spartinae]|uniref:PUM-HD domain-containing protein n=1 Tax=Scheffersomyces spartinae TaxID=45513 RepID=A0A9P7VCW7_9ASCO|nr:uncharacterized protein KQ657_003160 [Scheffersomyces spartinae]KAG7195402.1 hypothetical protein KQ657_003160 [Scheffersomyces spartinae]